MTEVSSAPVWGSATGASSRWGTHIGRAEVDVAVIGGGLTGVSTALHLIRERPDWTVMLLEADAIGAGASGLSTGICGPGVGGRIRPLAKRHGPDVAREMFRYSQDAVRTVVDLVDREGIDADVRPSRHLLGAYTGAQAAMLRKEKADFERLGLDPAWLSRDEVAARLGHTRYHGALAYDPVVVLDPLKLTVGLASAATRAGVRVVVGSRVTGMVSARGRVRLQVGTAGSVCARRVVVATDGYTPPDFPYGRRLVRLRTHVTATRPLTPAERAGTGWDGYEAVIDQRTFFSYYRLSGGRLLFGGGPVPRPDAPAAASERVFRRLHRELEATFPMLAGIPLEHRWSGLTSSTLDRLPVVGAVPGRDGVIFAGAWCGHGVSMSVATGRSVAEQLAAGRSPAGRPWNRSSTRTPSFGPFTRPAVASYVAGLDLVDRTGARLDRRRSAPAHLPDSAGVAAGPADALQA